VSVPVDVELEARVAEAVAAHREVITELVRQAVDRELVAPVDREPTPRSSSSPPTTAGRRRPRSRSGSTRRRRPSSSARAATPSRDSPTAASADAARPRTTRHAHAPAGANARRRRRPRRRAHTTTRRDRPTPPAAVAADGPHTAAHGVTARELLELGGFWQWLGARERWLLEQGFAERNGGRELYPTPRGLELGTGLDVD
jgi:hypothetical protein